MIWGSCQVPQDSLDRSPGKRHREGSLYALRAPPDVTWRHPACEHAVLHWLAFQRQGAFPCSVPIVLRAILQIFPTQNCYVFAKSPNLALKRSAKRSFWPQTRIFPMKNQYFWWKISTFSMGGLVLVFGWSLGGLGVVLGWWRVDEGSMKGSMKGRRRIDEGWSWADERSMKDRWWDQWRVDEGINEGSMKGRWRETKEKTISQANKQTIRQTIKQTNAQTNNHSNKQTKQKPPKKKPYIKK